ncbi:MAG: tRNA pseudouridine(13) synthase TruD, partial [Thermoprotei archaeon]
NTHIIGYYIIKRNFRKAVEELVNTVYPNESDMAKEARERASEGDIKAALELMPKSLKHERIVLSHLLRRPNDFIGAIRRLPLTTKRLFVQSYQSYIFNRILSLRLLRGISLRYPEEGDRVSLISRRGELRGAIVITSVNRKTFLKLINEGRATLVLPLIGYGYTPSGGLQGDIEREVLEIEGIDNTLFKIQEMPELSLKGGVRPSIFAPLDIQIVAISEDDFHPGRLKLVLRFTLKKGLYATVVLRELMKPSSVFKAGF